MDHVGPVRAVEGEQEEHRVVGREGQELSEFARHGRRFRGAGGRWAILLGAEAVAAGLALLPDARTALLPYLLLFAAGSLLAIFAARSLSGSGSGSDSCSSRAPLLRVTLLSPAAGSLRRRLPLRLGRAGGFRGHLPLRACAVRPARSRVSLPRPPRRCLTPTSGPSILRPRRPAFRAALGLGEGSSPLKAIFAAADLSVGRAPPRSRRPRRGLRGARSMPSTRCP